MYQSNLFRKCAAFAAAGCLLTAAAGAFPAGAEDTGYIFCDSFEDGASGRTVFCFFGGGYTQF